MSSDGKSGEDKGGGGGAIIGLLLATLIAGGGGAFVGMSQFAVPHPPAEAKADEPKAENKYVQAARVRALAPLTTNLAGNPAPWIRLEASVLVSDEVAEEDTDKLTATISEDVIAYLRTVPVAQIQGPSGYQSLREDLDERVRIRSEGMVKELIIQSLILE